VSCPVSTAPGIQSALSPGDIAGIAAEPWRQMVEAGDTGQNTADLEQLLAQLSAIAGHGLQSTLHLRDSASSKGGHY